MNGLPPLLLAALINQLGAPEFMRWLISLHETDQVITIEVALAKLNMDIDQGNAAGLAALAAHGG